eukprot:COSAG02_NODE_650_length_18912_cov_23.728698_12_plen_65_part_00
MVKAVQQQQQQARISALSVSGVSLAGKPKRKSKVYRDYQYTIVREDQHCRPSRNSILSRVKKQS